MFACCYICIHLLTCVKVRTGSHITNLPLSTLFLLRGICHGLWSWLLQIEALASTPFFSTFYRCVHNYPGLFFCSARGLNSGPHACAATVLMVQVISLDQSSSQTRESPKLKLYYLPGCLLLRVSHMAITLVFFKEMLASSIFLTRPFQRTAQT